MTQLGRIVSMYFLNSKVVLVIVLALFALCCNALVWLWLVPLYHRWLHAHMMGGGG